MPVPSLFGIISELLHPPIDLLHLEAFPANPYSGDHGFNRVRGTRPVDAHGIFWNVAFAPAGYGLTVDATGNRYDRAVIAIDEFEQLLDGTLSRSPLFESDQAQGRYLFVGEIPFVIDVHLPPGLTMTLSWLVLF